MRVLVAILCLLAFLGGGVGALSFFRARQASEIERLAHQQALEDERQARAGNSARRVPVPEQARAEQVPVQAAPGTDAAAQHKAELAKRNNMAVQALDNGEYERAVELLNECHEGEPQNETYRKNLAEALARLARQQHDLDQEPEAALASLARAVELCPERPELSQLLERWKREAQDDHSFWHDRSEHFDLSYDGAREDLLDSGPALSAELEDLYGELVPLFGVDIAGAGKPPIKVILYRRAEFGELTGLGDWSAGAFDGVVRVPIEKLRSEQAALRRVLRHELTHAFVRGLGGSSVPGWLNEGMAQWLENRSNAEIAAIRQRAAGTERIELEKLRGTLASWPDKSTIGQAYDQSLLLVLAIAREYGERQVYELIAGCAKGEKPDETFQRRFAFPLSSLNLY